MKCIYLFIPNTWDEREKSIYFCFCRSKHVVNLKWHWKNVSNKPIVFCWNPFCIHATNLLQSILSLNENFRFHRNMTENISFSHVKVWWSGEKKNKKKEPTEWVTRKTNTNIILQFLKSSSVFSIITIPNEFASNEFIRIIAYHLNDPKTSSHFVYFVVAAHLLTQYSN